MMLKESRMIFINLILFRNVVIKNYDVTLLFDNSRFKEKLLDVKIIKLSTKE